MSKNEVKSTKTSGKLKEINVDLSLRFKAFFSKVGSFFKKVKEKLKTFFSKPELKDKSNLIGTFLLMVVSYGFILNFMLWSIWKIPFTRYSFLGYGILVYFIRDEFVSFYRRLTVK